MPLLKVIRNGQVTLPARFRQLLSIKEGDYLEAELQENQIVLKPAIVLDRAEAIQRLHQLMDEVGKRHEDAPEEEVERDVLEAIESVRQQETPRKHARPKSRR